MARRRRTTAFSLSFLDIMSCGFGAIVLVYLIMTHQSEVLAAADETATATLGGEVDTLSAEVEQALQQLELTTSDSRDRDRQIASLQTELTKLADAVRADRTQASTAQSALDLEATEIEDLRREISALRREVFATPGANAADDVAAATLQGDGNRLYVSGLRTDGRRVLILLDRSTSMLEDELVNILRARNMAPERQRRAGKWLRAVRATRWLGTQLPLDGQFQLYTFSEQVAPTVPDSEGQWLRVADDGVETALAPLEEIVPAGGTNLRAAFRAVASFSPPPDMVYLITDGLPTRDDEPPRSDWVSGNTRRRLFDEAIRELPRDVPVNIILFPVDGDPRAAMAYWRLAVQTSGALMSPARDWP